MIDQADIMSGGISAESYQQTLAEQWKRLADSKQLLESDLTATRVANIIASIQEVVSFIATLPGETALKYIISRDALSEYLRQASIELSLLRSQLTIKSQTRLFYKSLATCQCYLEKALQQRNATSDDWQGISWQTAFMRQNNMRVGTGDNTLHQGRYHQINLLAALEALRYIHRSFQEQPEIWPDQCTHSLALVGETRKLMQSICCFLDSLAGSYVAISPHYCHLVVVLHYACEQACVVHLQLTHYRIICRSSSARSADTKQTIVHLLESLLQSTEESIHVLTALLDQAHFQRRKGGSGEAETCFA
jgi:hypothetical protein